MGTEKTKDHNARQPAGPDDLAGGTEPSPDVSRLVDPATRGDGTRGTTAPSGGVHPPPPGKARTTTDVLTEP